MKEKNKCLTFGLYCILFIYALLGTVQYCNAKGVKKEDRVVFSWKTDAIENSGKELFELLEKVEVTIVYQNISPDADKKTIKKFLKNAHRQGVSVYLLAGDHDWCLKYRKTPYVDVVKRAEKYNQLVKKECRIEGVVFDVEPYTLNEWHENKETLMSNYVGAMKKSYKVAKKKKLSMVACIPYFYEEKEMKKELIDLIQNGCDEIAVMNYYRKNEKQHIKTEAKYALKYKKRLINIYEFNEPGTHGLIEINTYYNKGLKTAKKNFKKLKRYYKKQDIIMGLHDVEMLKKIIEKE